MSNNPLMQFARRAELSVKLALAPSWYPEDFIKYTINGEVEVYPMLPKDELMLYNPDALLSGQAIINMIKSCCPGISNPELLYYPDANILLLAIKKATYGNEHKQNSFCPKCYEKLREIEELRNNPDSSKELEKKEKEFDKLLNEGKVTDHEYEYTFNIDEILSSITYLNDDYEVEIDGLIYSFQPHILKLKEQYSLISGKRNKLLKMYQETLNKEDGDISDEEKTKIMKEISEIQADMIDTNNIIFSESIKFIKLPDGSIVEDKDMIREFISNCKSPTMNKISEEITKLNNYGIQTTFKVECPYCHHEYEIQLSGYNQSDFFE